MNVWTFSGNLGRDAEQAYTAKGHSVVKFSVAVAAGFGERKSTTWVRCSMWGKRGESVLPYLVKGQQVVVSGEAELREFDKRDGSGKGYSMELRVNDLTLVGGQKAGSQDGMTDPVEPEQSGGFRDKPQTPPVDDNFGDEDIPF